MNENGVMKYSQYWALYIDKNKIEPLEKNKNKI